MHWGGGTGNDTPGGRRGRRPFLRPGQGDDSLLGGAGEDFLASAARATTSWRVDDGDDRLFAQGGGDDLEGGAGADTLVGGNGNDRLGGGGGDDRLFGQAGDDRLDGGGGSDLLRGDAGDDRFVFSGAHGDDTIADFTGGDRIDLSAFGLDGFGDVRAEAVGGGVRLDLGDEGGGTILLRGVELADLDAGDFLL